MKYYISTEFLLRIAYFWYFIEQKENQLPY